MQQCYQLAVGHWKLPPSEFWRITLQEFYWMLDANAPPTKGPHLSADEVDELIALHEQMTATRNAQ